MVLCAIRVGLPRCGLCGPRRTRRISLPMAKPGRSPANDEVPTSPAEGPERLRWLRQRPGAPSWQGIPAARARAVVWVLHCELVPATIIACPPYYYIVARLTRAVPVSFSLDVDIPSPSCHSVPHTRAAPLVLTSAKSTQETASTPQNPSHRESLGALWPTIRTSAEPPPSLPETPTLLSLYLL